ncbi:TAXI family TRAP transporter solute-binding subunit [Halanaerobiaceae bacterium Z-7014]|uniref:TAXI family TRAP transporter solute-binding subunit n=1 Tax=Halonatronomonas betaini TaxID=2778430 RepID=A0A931AMP4_9FIRM|nr:TAXI family TRAP transporter solute-binding subunit [Halonatronomonas betaini]MBF8435547.1 TAXI family TRAP transporter solute-binding subunit [Halonatronomonas betaini]
MKKLLTVFIVVLLIMAFSTATFASEFIGIATGSTGGTFYPVGVTIATVIEDAIGEEMNVRFSAHTSGGSADNLQMLAYNEIEMAIVGAVPTSQAYLGVEQYEGAEIKNLRYVTALYPEVIQFVYRLDSDIETVHDLVGKRVALGPPGGGGTFYTPPIFEAVGDFTEADLRAEYMGYSDSAQAMQNNLISAAYLGASYPTAAVSELFASPVNVDIIEFTDDEIADLQELAPYFTKVVIPEGTYPGQDRNLSVVGFKTAIVVTEDVSEDIIYAMLNAFYLEELEELHERQSALKPVVLEEAIAGLSGAPLHPGAVRFYEEQGFEIPEELLPPEL